MATRTRKSDTESLPTLTVNGETYTYSPCPTPTTMALPTMEESPAYGVVAFILPYVAAAGFTVRHRKGYSTLVDSRGDVFAAIHHSSRRLTVDSLGSHRADHVVAALAAGGQHTSHSGVKRAHVRVVSDLTGPASDLLGAMLGFDASGEQTPASGERSRDYATPVA